MNAPSTNGDGQHFDGAATADGRHRDGHVLITGGAGFIGTNLAAALLADGVAVTVYDNLSRAGVRRNLHWLRDYAETVGGALAVRTADVRDERRLRQAVAGAAAVYHLAAQVAVTTSLQEPREDFEVNALGTLNLLEACRACDDPPRLLFTSTNKVYGALADVPLRSDGDRYLPADDRLRRRGVAETRPLDFYSPYGCSKGTADQYVLDYARCFGLPATVFRMSCIYGPHQCGNEDQGWVAHFARQNLRRRPITFYGDGRQVRDLLFVDDLVAALRLALGRIDDTRGRAFNIGGGTGNAVSLREVVEQLGETDGELPRVCHGEWRTGDQRYYVSDTTAFTAATGWRPQIDVPDGLRRLVDWLAVHGPDARPSEPMAGVR